MFNSRKSRIIISFIAGIVFTVGLLILLNFSFVQNESYTDYFPQGYKIVTPPIPDNLSFCGEPVPMNDPEVRERIEREFIVNTYWHSSTVLLIKKANRWFPVIEPILHENGIPDDFKFIAMIESNLSDVVSPAGATGFWQFIKSAAIKYDLEVNGEVDERYNVEKATEAACKYLKDSKKKFGTWTLAAASYNMGKFGVDNQLDRQKEASYYDLTLNEETSRYIARALSMKEIISNPRKYGFDILEYELYEPLKTKDVTINNKVEHFSDFAKSYGITYKTLKYYNPWLRENYLTNRQKKTYTIKIPVK